MAIYYNNAAMTTTESHTIQEFINIGNSISDNASYPSISYIETRDGYEMIIKNILDDYMEEIMEEALEIEFSPKDIETYKFNPKMLSYKIYGTTKLYYVILKMNNLCNVHEFTISKGKLLLLPKKALSHILSIIYSRESVAINTYNNNHSRDKIIKPIEKFITKSYTPRSIIDSTN